MFQTCAFCDGALGGDGGPSGLGVGKRFAFDEWRGRLWVVCPKCARWNLTPFDDRLEKIDALARLVPEGTLIARTEQVALIRWNRYDLVRVGRPPRAELAGWRYGERLRQRQRDRAKIVVPVVLVTVGATIALNAAVGGGFGMLFYNVGNIGDAVYSGIMGRRRVRLVEPPECASCGTIMQLRAKHVRHARVVTDARVDLGVIVSCPQCHCEGALLTGDDAAQTLRQGLTFLNARRSGRRSADIAARHVDAAGGPDEFIRGVARRSPTLRGLPADGRLALEMAVDEAAEVRELERQWRDAEELARIADGTLSTTPTLADQLAKLGGPVRNQPDS
jgi:hypothetical protein